MDMDVVTRGYWAEALCTNDFICLDTYSGYRGGTDRDPKGVQHLLPVDANDEELGAAALDAMAHSRFVLSGKRDGYHYPPDLIFDPEMGGDYLVSGQWYKDWVKNLMDLYGYKTKKQLFSGMNLCYFEKKNGVITISPRHHEKLEAWSRGPFITEADNVIIPDTSTATEVGAALRLAFSRCTSDSRFR